MGAATYALLEEMERNPVPEPTPEELLAEAMAKDD